MLASVLMRDRSRQFFRSLGSPFFNSRLIHVMVQVSGNTPSYNASFSIEENRSRVGVCARSRG